MIEVSSVRWRSGTSIPGTAAPPSLMFDQGRQCRRWSRYEFPFAPALLIAGSGPNVNQINLIILRSRGQPPPPPTRVERPNKKPRPKAGAFLQLVPETGVEPATYALRMRRSTN